MPNNITERDINLIRKAIRTQREVCSRLAELFGEDSERFRKALQIYREMQTLFHLVYKKGDESK